MKIKNLLLLLLTVVTLFSCSKDDESQPKAFSLKGTWEAVDMVTEYKEDGKFTFNFDMSFDGNGPAITFNGDGTGQRLKSDEETEVVSNVKMKYAIKDNQLNIYDFNSKMNAYETEPEVNTYKLIDNKLELVLVESFTEEGVLHESTTKVNYIRKK